MYQQHVSYVEIKINVYSSGIFHLLFNPFEDSFAVIEPILVILKIEYRLSRR